MVSSLLFGEASLTTFRIRCVAPHLRKALFILQGYAFESGPKKMLMHEEDAFIVFSDSESHSALKIPIISYLSKCELKGIVCTKPVLRMFTQNGFSSESVADRNRCIYCSE
jgi:hypothetical protein